MVFRPCLNWRLCKFCPFPFVSVHLYPFPTRVHNYHRRWFHRAQLGSLRWARLGLQVWPRGSLGIDMGALGCQVAPKWRQFVPQKRDCQKVRNYAPKQAGAHFSLPGAASESVSFAISIPRYCLESTLASTCLLFCRPWAQQGAQMWSTWCPERLQKWLKEAF